MALSTAATAAAASSFETEVLPATWAAMSDFLTFAFSPRMPRADADTTGHSQVRTASWAAFPH